MLTLPEEMLLIAIDDDTGKMSMTASQYIYYGMAGAILMELTMRGCLDYQNKKLLTDRSDTGDDLLNDSLQYIQSKQKGRVRSLTHWVSALSSHLNWRKKHLPYIERLIDRGILKQEESRFLFFFTKDVYPTANSEKENAIRERVKSAVLSDDKDVDEQTIALIGLLKACNMDKFVFSKEEYKMAKGKITQIMKNSPHGKAVSDTIKAMEAAVIAAVAAAAAASSSSSSSS